MSLLSAGRREALSLAKAAGKSELTPAQLEGVAAAKLVVEALKRTTGKEITRDGFTKALDSARIDLGGLQVHYTDKDHNGLEFTDVSIIGPDGKFWR